MNPPDVPFDAPWQAQLFAMTVALNEAGLFNWSEWAEMFGPKVQTVEAEAYWSMWSEALIEMLQSRGITDACQVAQLTAEWQAAAHATPHGQPIALTVTSDS